MAIVEKITQEDLALYEILRNPVLCNEFINNYDKKEWEDEFIFDWYQVQMLCDFHYHVSIATARSIGKTVSLVSLLTWIVVFKVFPGFDVVYTVPSRVHLQPVWRGLIRSFRSNSFLRNFVSATSGFNSSTFEVTLLNQSTITCRIAGTTGTGANVIGLHVPFVILDESGYYPWGTWVELQPIINTFTQGHRLMTAGVPTGIREKNVLWTNDQEDSSYTKHTGSAFDNPRFTEKDHKDAIEKYGGEDNEDYIHLVLGEHGAPVFSIFDRNTMKIEPYAVHRLVLNGIELRENLGNYIPKLALLPALPTQAKEVYFGIDLGYTDPTAIIIFYSTASGQLKFHLRVQLNKVSYAIQDKIIDLLDTRYNPKVLGVDWGSAGISVIQKLQDSEEFLHKDYKKRIIPINFSSQISLGFDSDGEEIKSKTKPFSVSVLQEYSNSHKFIYSSTDLELISELERMTYSKTPSGDIVYKTLTPRGGKRGDDHFTAALLCGSMAYYLDNEYFIPARNNQKLFKSRWLK
jgi:hypothetical protein